MTGDEIIPNHYPTYEDMEEEIIEYPTRLEQIGEICPYIQHVIQLNLRRAYIDDEGLVIEPFLRTSQQWVNMIKELARGLEGPAKADHIRESYESLVKLEKDMFSYVISRMIKRLKRRVLPFTKLMDDLVDARNMLVSFRQTDYTSIRPLENDVKPILQKCNDISMKMWSHGLALTISFLIAMGISFLAGTQF